MLGTIGLKGISAFDASRLRNEYSCSQQSGWLQNVAWVEDMSRSEVRRAMWILIEQQALLLAWWEDMHGRTD